MILYEVFAKGYEKRNTSINCTHRIFVFQPFDFERTRNASCALNLISTFFFIDAHKNAGMNSGAPEGVLISSCSTSGTRRLTIVKYVVVSHECGKMRLWWRHRKHITWSFVPHIQYLSFFDVYVRSQISRRVCFRENKYTRLQM